MTDPIAGQREAINEGKADALLFAYFEPGTKRIKVCPVKRGESFELRTCRIVCGTPVRIGKHGRWQWRVPVTRHKRVSADKVRLLDKRSGYTDDPRSALSAANISEDEHWREVAENLGPPPEPEAIDPEIIASLPMTVAAQANYEREQRERRAAFEALPLSERVRRLEGLNSPKVGRQLARIAEATEAAERKLRRHGDCECEAA